MTRHYSVTINGPAVTFVAHKDGETASEFEMDRVAQGYCSRAFGNIDGEAYLVVYYKPVGRTILTEEGNDTSKGQKGPQKAQERHIMEAPACEGCPECVVLFDEEGGYYGKVPDTHSTTCRGCEHNDRRTE